VAGVELIWCFKAGRRLALLFIEPSGQFRAGTEPAADLPVVQPAPDTVAGRLLFRFRFKRRFAVLNMSPQLHPIAKLISSPPELQR
jgi:hypothetical protein